MATSAFGKAFAAARKAGEKTFEFNGKKYTTETREDVVKKRNEAVGRKAGALPEKSATTKAREYTSEMAKKERAADRAEAQRKDSAAIAKDVANAKTKRFVTDTLRDVEKADARGRMLRDIDTAAEKRKVSGFAKGGGIELRGNRKCKIV